MQGRWPKDIRERARAATTRIAAAAGCATGGKAQLEKPRARKEEHQARAKLQLLPSADAEESPPRLRRYIEMNRNRKIM